MCQDKSWVLSLSQRPHLTACPALPAAWGDSRWHWPWCVPRLRLLLLLADCSGHGKSCSLRAALPPAVPCHPSSSTREAAGSLAESKDRTVTALHQHPHKPTPAGATRPSPAVRALRGAHEAHTPCPSKKRHGRGHNGETVPVHSWSMKQFCVRGGMWAAEGPGMLGWSLWDPFPGDFPLPQGAPAELPPLHHRTCSRNS